MMCRYNSITVCTIFTQRRSPTPHFLWGAHRGGYDLQIRLGRDLCTMHLPPSFILFTRSEVNRVDKQTDAAENIQCASLHYDIV